MTDSKLKRLQLFFFDKDLNLLKEANEYFSAKGWEINVASIKSQAMEMILMREPEVIVLDISDLEKENEFFKALRKIGIESQIISYSHTISDDIKYKKQIGLVFGFVKKSDGFEILEKLILEAKRTFQKIHEINFKLQKENDEYKRELEWLLWQHRKEHNSKHVLGKTIMETLTHSIFQGMGMGAALSVIDLLDYSKQEDGDFVKVKKKLFHSLLKNSNPMKLIKQKLDNMITILDEEFEREVIESKEVVSILKKVVKDLIPFSEIKKQIVSLEEFNFTGKVVANKKFLQMTFTELLTNAFKYSPDNSTIYITKGFSVETLNFLFINSVSKVTKGIKGIPPEYENLVFEPFFRINRIYDERFYLEELGFGLGLSILQKGIQSLGGKIFIYEGMDHVTSAEPEKKIFAEIHFLKK